MPKTIPQMPWFPRDFRASTALWSFEARAVYRSLLDLQWELGSLPDDPTKIRKNLNIPLRFWRRFDEFWEQKFPLQSDGTRANPTLEEHRRKYIDLSYKNSEKARLAARARWDAPSNASSNANAMPPVQSSPKEKKTAPSERQKKARKHALPKDWQPSEELLRWKAEKFPHVNTQLETDKFTDYWISKAETRADWDATWRNWIRKASEQSNGNRSNGSTAHLSAVDRVRRATGVRL